MLKWLFPTGHPVVGIDQVFRSIFVLLNLIR